MEVKFIPHKTWWGRPSALLYYWRRKNWVRDASDVDNIIRFAQGVDVELVKSGRVTLITPKEYSLKYGVPLKTVYRQFAKGWLAGVVVGGRILLVDGQRPPQPRKKIDINAIIEKVEALGVRGMGARMVALIQIPYPLLKHAAYSRGARLILDEFRKQNRLYRIKRSYYVLFSRVGVMTKEELMSLYPDPNEIILPRRGNVSWEMVEFLSK